MLYDYSCLPNVSKLSLAAKKKLFSISIDYEL